MSTSAITVSNGASIHTITPRAVSRAASHASISSAPLGDPLANDDDLDQTVTGKRLMLRGKQRSQEDLRVLAVSAQITEISYSISDIQTRIFEIQELRHQTLADDAHAPGSTTVIDQALVHLNERLTAVASSISAIDKALGISTDADSATKAAAPDGTDMLLLRKHAALVEEWTAIQAEADVLRDELKEDKWLAVFRTVSEQAEAMMASLDKGVTQCHDFIWQAHRRGQEDVHSRASTSTTMLADKSPINYESFTTILQSFESKKKYYMPSITKVLAVLDKGVSDRVTKNGECLRRHADLRARWRNLRDRIGRIDTEMEGVRRMLVNRDIEPSEAGSHVSHTTSKSRTTQHSTPGTSARSTSTSRTVSTAALTRSISPFSNIRKFATKVSDKLTGRQTPSVYASPAPSSNGSGRAQHNDSASAARTKNSFFPFRSGNAPETPPRAKHGHSHSLVATHSPSTPSVGESAQKRSSKDKWNSSTKIDNEHAPPPTTTLKGILRNRPSTSLLSPTSLFRSISPAGSSAVSRPISRPITPAAASSLEVGLRPPLSRPASRAASRSGALTSSSKTSSPAGAVPPVTPSRPPSRAMSRSGAQTPGGSRLPKARPQTPSHIPAPRSKAGFSPDVEVEEDWDGMPTTIMQRAFSPAFSVSAASAISSGNPARPRTPSTSLIPVPKLNLPPSRPGSAAGSAPWQTPSGMRSASKGGIPPSSYRDASVTPPRMPSRAGSRATTPLEGLPSPTYTPVRTDPLDVEVAKCVNGFPHAFTIERLDPPLRVAPKAGEEVRAQYAISNTLARKIVTCKLVIVARAGKSSIGPPDSGETRKVMCRVGGGWLDLQMYLLNRMAGTS